MVEVNLTHLMPIAAARQYPGSLGFVDSKALFNRFYILLTMNGSGILAMLRANYSSVYVVA
jgi:hypothetical protein